MGEYVDHSISEAVEKATYSHGLSYLPQSAFSALLEGNYPAIEKTALFAQMARFNTLYMVARAGSGHLGSSFSSLDIVSWLFLNVLKPQDRYFSSKGHDAPGLYAVLTGLGILPHDKIHALRRLGGVPGHPDVNTPGIVTNTGSLGMGVSKAKGFLFADDLIGASKGRVFVLTGDGELQEGQFWESLLSAARRTDARLTVIVDHNKMQSDIAVSKVSDLGDLIAKFRAFGWDAHRCNGHDYTALGKLVGTPDDGKRSKVIVADTIKGRGVSFMEHTAMAVDQEYYRFHSGAPTQDDYRNAVTELLRDIESRRESLGMDKFHVMDVGVEPLFTPASFERMIPAYSEAILEEAALNPRLVALDADLVLDTGLIPFKEKFPNRFVECGIAEQDMVSQAGTMALSGLLPVVHSFACFLTSRASEQIYNNCTERQKIVYVGSLAGVLPSGPGHSHQAVRDVTAMSAMPGITILEPVNAEQVKALFRWAVQHNENSTYLRLTSVPYDSKSLNSLGNNVVEGRGDLVYGQSGDVTIVSVGPIMTNIAASVMEQLKESGINGRVICTPWLNRIDIDWYREMLAHSRLLLTFENHYTERGFGSWFISELAMADLLCKCRTQMFGIRDIPACGHSEEVLVFHGLSVHVLAKQVVQLYGLLK